MVRDIFWQLLGLARGLEHLSRHGILHQDIKGENCMVAPDGTLKIVDYGLAGRAVGVGGAAGGGGDGLVLEETTSSGKEYEVTADDGLVVSATAEFDYETAFPVGRDYEIVDALNQGAPVTATPMAYQSKKDALSTTA